MKQLLEAGVHFGHQTKRWNPKMKEYIFGERNGIYIIDHAQPRALAATQLDGADLDLWHRRLGHLGFRNIRNLQRMSTGIKHFKPRYCEACATGKQNEKPHTHAISKGSYPLEQIHIDIAYRETSGPHGE
jgi:hypothetical protein